MLGALGCSIAGHRVNRRRVWEDGLSYRTRCDRCDKPLIRDRNGWRAFDLENDMNDERRPHPTTGEPV